MVPPVHAPVADGAVVQSFSTVRQRTELALAALPSGR